VTLAKETAEPKAWLLDYFMFKFINSRMEKTTGDGRP